MHTEVKIVVGETRDAWGDPYPTLLTEQGAPIAKIYGSPDNARRLAACWNACAGLSTEQVEALDVAVLRNQLAVSRGQVWVLRKACTVARDILGKLQDELDELSQENPGIGLGGLVGRTIHGCAITTAALTDTQPSSTN